MRECKIGLCAQKNLKINKNFDCEKPGNLAVCHAPFVPLASDTPRYNTNYGYRPLGIIPLVSTRR